MMNRERVRRLACLAVVSLALAACGGGEATTDETVDSATEDASNGVTDDSPGEEGAAVEFDEMTLTYTTWIGPDIGHGQAMLAFMERVEERTNGAVTFEPFWNGGLCGAVETTECISTGRADIGYSSPSFVPADMPASQLGSVPFQTSNSQANTNALNDMAREAGPIADELAATNQHMLWYGPVPNAFLGLTAPIESLSDLNGRSVRTVGYTVIPLMELGVEPVAATPEEQYENLQRGVLDGFIYSSDGVMDSRLYEVVDYLYDTGPYLGSYGTVYTAMNKDTWDAMDPALQQIFNEESERIGYNLAAEFHEPYDEEACQILAREVDVIAEFPDPDAAQAWADEMRDAVAAQWVEAAEEAGLENATDLLEEYRNRVAEYEESVEFRASGEVCREIATQ